MISEFQQEQAALHALGLLDANEVDAFEQELRADGEVRAFTREMEETISRLAWAGDRAMQQPSPELKARVQAAILAERGGHPARTVAFRSSRLPWALAALLLGCSGVLFYGFTRERARAGDLHASAVAYQRLLLDAQAEASRAAAVDPLAKISFCALEPTSGGKPASPEATVLWDEARRQGRLRIAHLLPPAEGKDYQLWTVVKGRQDTVSAGVFHVNAAGEADVPVQPVDADDKPVMAVAISLERAGGSPTNQGPILLLGKF